jgi:hypothetical protein
VLAVLLAAPVSAQTFTELLQKAIYTQDTLGDIDGAIRIYQQILAGAPAASDIRRQAERRLRAAEAQRRTIPARPLLPPVPLGTSDGRTYRHTRTGLTFDVPELWRVHRTSPSSDDGEMVMMSSVDPAASIAVWMIPEKNDWNDINEKLDASPFLKVQNRVGFAGYRLREGSVQRVSIAGHQAMVAIADYTDPSGAMAELMTWIYTEKTHTFFFARVQADQLEHLRPQFDSMVYSAIIP